MSLSRHGHFLPEKMRSAPGVDAALSAVMQTPRAFPRWEALADALEKAGHPSDPAQLLRQAIKADPAWPAARICLVKVLCDRGKTDAAARQVEAFRQTGASPRAQARLDFLLAKASENLPALAATDPASVSDGPHQAGKAAIDIAGACFSTGDPDRGRAILRESGVEMSARELAGLARALTVASSANAAIEFLEWWTDTTGDTVQTRAALEKVVRHTGTTARSDALARRLAPDAGSDDPQLQAWITDILGSTRDSLGGQDAAVLREALLQALDGDLPPAIDGLRRLAGTGRLSASWTAQMERLAALLQFVQDAPAPQRTLVDGRDTGPVLVSPSCGNGRIALIFCSLAGRLAGVPLNIIDRYFAAFGYDTILLTDPGAKGGTGGFAPLGASAKETVSVLRNMLTQGEYRTVLSVGVSSGGYSALRYGIELDADRVVTFSGGTVARSIDMKALGDRRVGTMVQRVDELDPSVSFVEPVAAVLEARPDHPPIDLHFGAGNTGDRKQARALEGFDRVTLHIHETAIHNTFTPFLLGGGFRDLLC